MSLRRPIYYSQKMYFTDWLCKLQNLPKLYEYDYITEIRQECKGNFSTKNIHNLLKAKIKTKRKNNTFFPLYKLENVILLVKADPKKIRAKDFVIDMYGLICGTLPKRKNLPHKGFILNKLIDYYNLPLIKDTHRLANDIRFLDSWYTAFPAVMFALAEKYPEIVLQRPVLIIQRFWRRILAERRLQRLRIGREIMLLPGIGQEYYTAAKRFEANIVQQ